MKRDLAVLAVIVLIAGVLGSVLPTSNRILRTEAQTVFSINTNIEAEEGVVSSPYMVENGQVFQTMDRNPSNGGVLAVTFEVPVLGNYTVAAYLNAETVANNSVYINMDSLPDGTMQWGMPVTGPGVWNWEYATIGGVQKTWVLEPGTHTLYMVGREKYNYIDKVRIEQAGTSYSTPYDTPYGTPYETPYATPEYPTPYATPEPPPPGAQLNVVFVLTDDQTYEALERMPHIASRTDWVEFSQMILNVSLCCPSRATILSGQYSHRTGVEHNRAGNLLDESTLFPTWLDLVGYTNSFIGKYLNGYTFGRGNYTPPGWDDWHAFYPGSGDKDSVFYTYYMVENGNLNYYGTTTADYSTDVIRDKAVNFIQTASEPFFLHLTPLAPHEPSIPAERHWGYFDDVTIFHSPNFNEEDVSDKPAWIQALGFKDSGKMRAERRKMWMSLLAVDEMVRDVFTALENRGILENTVVIFMSDNGYALGEHRFYTKRCPYEECQRVPFLVRYPGATPRTIDALVSNTDLAATFADIAGATPSVPQDGQSLIPLINGTTQSIRDAVLIHWGGGQANGKDGNTAIPEYWGVRTDQYKYLEYPTTGEKELYDLDVDPYEMENKINDPAYDAIEADLAAKLAALRAE